MKYITLLLFLISQVIYTTAQITITSNDIANIGTELPRIIDNNPDVTITPGAPGSNLIWDFSSISTDVNDTVCFADVNTTPYANEFPNSNLCIKLGTDIDYAYTTVTNESIQIQGASQYIDQLEDNVVAHFNPEQTNIIFPATYGTSFNDSYGFTVIRYYGETVTLPGVPFPVMVDSVKIVSATDATQIFDSWGELITPYGDFSTIRNKRVDYIENELYAKSNLLGYWIDVTTWLGEESTDTVCIYSWWAKEIGYPVFEIQTDYNTEAVIKASCLIVEDISIKKLAEEKITTTVFPVPANKHLNIKTNYEGSAVLKIYDMTGSLILKENINKSLQIVNIGNLSESLYFYTITGKDKTEVGQGKFYVVR